MGNYGEVMDWLTQIYNVTRPEPGQPGDEKILAQCAKIVRAREAFRYPLPDANGNRAMRLGWRDHNYPGPVVYAQIGRRDGSPLDTAALTLDPHVVGSAQQMLADNQFFAALTDMMKMPYLFETLGMMGTPDSYDKVRAQSHSPYKLPMTEGQPDFVFSDEEDGVVAIKNGRDILYVSLYWRARNAVNFLARVHFLTPTTDRVAVAREEVRFLHSGMTWTRPDDILFPGMPWIPRYPVNTGSAEAGEELPIAKIPPGIHYSKGDESVYAGKGEFYTLRYGPYLIAMNLTTNQDFNLSVPTDLFAAKDLVTGKTPPPGDSLKVGPKSTVVLFADHARFSINSH